MQVTPTQGPETPVDPSGLLGSFYTQGIAADSDGFIYMARTSPSVAVLKIDPRVPGIVKTYVGSLINPWDVLVNGDYVYVSDYTGKQIVRLTRNLDFVDSFSGPASDPFLGPERFVAILNKPITVIDEGGSGGPDRLVSFNDMTGAGWTPYGSHGGGPGQFVFFLC